MPSRRTPGAGEVSLPRPREPLAGPVGSLGKGEVVGRVFPKVFIFEALPIIGRGHAVQRGLKVAEGKS